MSLSRRRSARRTSGKTVSLNMRRLLLMRLLLFAEPLWSRTVIFRDLKCEDETSGYTTNTKCSKWPNEVCSVSKKPVKKYTPITGCTKEPRELCAPAGCGFKQGAEECYDKTQTVVQDAPKEQCSLEPQRTCKHVTKLVPKLEPTEECVDVPKEVCTRSRTNPRKVKKPVVKKWCYIPSEESGLA